MLLHVFIPFLISLAFVSPELLRIFRGRASPPGPWPEFPERLRFPAQACFWAALGAFTALEVHLSRTLFAGVLTFDEHGFARGYTQFVLRLIPTYAGATHVTAAFIYDLWYRVASFSPADARTMSALIGTAGVGLTYFSVRRLRSEKEAMLAALFLRFSPVWILFSATAVEVSFTFLAIPFWLWLASARLQQAWQQALAGFALAVLLFTYPGVPFLAAAVMVCALAFERKALKAWAGERKWLLLTFFIAFDVLAWLHFGVLSPRFGPEAEAGLFRGGGRLPSELAELGAAARNLLADTFLGGRSLFLESMPRDTFFPAALLPVMGLGAISLWRARDRRYRVLLAAGLLAFLGCFFVTTIPGMRRLAGLIPVACFLAAAGVGAAAAPRRAWLAVWLLGVLGWRALILPAELQRPILYQQDYVLPFPDAEMERSLSRGNLFIDPNEFSLWALRKMVLGQRMLLAGKHESIGNVFFRRDEAPANACLVWLTWRDLDSLNELRLGATSQSEALYRGFRTYRRVEFLDTPFRKQYCGKP